MARRMTAGDGVVLSHLEFDLLWSDLDVGEMPYPLQVRSHGFTMDEREELGGDVFETLEQAGLTDGDEVSAELERRLMLLRNHMLSVDALLFGEKPLSVLAAAGPREAVLAVLDPAELTLRTIRAAELADSVADLAGASPPGPGRPVTLARQVFSLAMRAFAEQGRAAFEDELEQAGLTGGAITALSAIVDSPRTCSGQLAANGPGGRSSIVTWFDTEAGRYGVTVTGTGFGRRVTVTPADKQWLSARMTELLDRVREVGPVDDDDEQPIRILR